ncbi:hypothetical protein HanHA300_Chr03g0077041 [Helianthus annuus]|nr:hypothetical protein HanHA300_Chr03g0077041 [Helianthus annuus]KAJ0606708.1 hypothetical protein HanHA89_Chr03g0088181 [Helianthus annuus]
MKTSTMCCNVKVWVNKVHKSTQERKNWITKVTLTIQHSSLRQQFCSNILGGCL